MSTAGLEPARVSPHAPQTCAYTDSATSTSIFDFQMSAYTSPLVKRYLIVLLDYWRSQGFAFRFEFLF